MKNLILTVSFALSLTSLFAQGPGCPSLSISSYQGTNLNSITLPCDSNCVALTANAFAIAQTNSYTVSAIPFTGLPYATNVGVGFNNEDSWSNVVNLPFNFCYFGAAYSQVIVSSNSAISFNTGPAGGYHAWNMNAGQQVPFLGGAFTGNTIFGCMQDLNPDCGGNIRYGVQGVFPCRAFVVTIDNVRLYKSASFFGEPCSNQSSRLQMVLYEGTNVIEIYVQNKPVESSWNGGLAVIGIQNAAGDVGYSPPGRNTGVWTANNEAWRFSPSGAPAFQIDWYEGDTNTVSLGTGPNFYACPSQQFSSFSALLTYTNCDNQSTQLLNAIDVNLSGPATPNFTTNSPVCENQTLILDGPTVAGATYFWTGPNGWTSGAEDPNIPNASAAISGTYNLYVVVAGCTSSIATQQVLVVGAASTPIFTTNSPVCEGQNIQLSTGAQPGATYQWSGPNGFTSNLQNPAIPATAAAAGTYSLFIQLGGCNSGTSQQTVIVNPTPATPNFTVNSPVCTLDDIIFDAPTIAGATYSWTGPGGWTSNVEDPTRPNASLGMAGTYNLTVTTNGCTSASASQNVVINGSANPTFSTNTPICGGEDLTFDGPTIPGATYVWSGPNGFNPGNVEDPIIPAATSSMTGTYSLYVVTNSCTSATETQNVYITPILSPPVTSNSPLCVGDTLFLSSSPIDSLGVYYWSGPNGFIDTTTASPFIPNVTVNMSGDYHLFIGTNGCGTDTATITVTVNPIPAAPTISSNSPVCEGGSLNLNGPTIAGAIYNWTGPNGYNSNSEDSTLTPAALNMAGTYNMFVDVLGCISPTSSTNVVVNDSPDVVPDVSPLTPCQGSTVSFDATVTLQAPSVILGSGWDVNGDGIPEYTSTQATHIYTAAGSYNAIYGVISTGNCTTLVTVPITVNPKPVVVYDGPTDNCGILVALDADGQVQTPATITDYDWYLTGGTAIGSGENLIHAFNANPFQQVTGYVVASTGDGCSDTANYSINLQPSPSAAFSVLPCIGLDVPFSNNTTWIGTPAPGATLGYSWTFGDGQNGTVEDPTHTYADPGTYSVTLIATSSAFGCADTIQSDIVVSAEPIVQITPEPQCFQTVFFTTQINSSGSNLQQFSWDLGDGGTSSDSVFTYEYQNSGTFVVTLTVTNEENCSTTVAEPITVLPGVTLSNLYIPNILTPNSDNVNDVVELDTQFETCNEYEMLIFNRWGNVVFKQVKGSVPFRGFTQDGKTRLSTGVYFYTVKSGELDKKGTITISY